MKASPLPARIAKVAVAVTLLLLVLRNVELQEVRVHLARLALAQVILLLGLYWLAQTVSTQRWRIFAGALGLRGPFISFLKIYFAGMFYGIGLTSAGGDLLKSYAVARQCRGSLSAAIAAVLLDRGSGLVTLLTLGAASLVAYSPTWRGMSLGWVYGIGWIAAAVMLLAVREGSRLPVPRRLGNLRSALQHVHLPAWATVQVVLLSFTNAGIVVLIVGLLFEFAGSPATLAQLCSIVPMIEVLTLLPVSVSGLGIREWAYLALFVPAGVPSETALAVALALSALILARNLAGALFLGAVYRPGETQG